LYKAYGLGGASFIINVLTDNSNRLNTDTRIAVNKNDSKMAEQSSVTFIYDRKGKVTIAGELDEETNMIALQDIYHSTGAFHSLQQVAVFTRASKLFISHPMTSNCYKSRAFSRSTTFILNSDIPTIKLIIILYNIFVYLLWAVALPRALLCTINTIPIHCY